MRVGLVRSAAFGMVALVGLGLVGCDDDPTDFGSDETVKITSNPSAMTVTSGVTTLLSSRTENEGSEPTWEEVTASVDASCGSATVIVEEAATYEPSIQPPGQFDVTGGNVLGETCITLTGGGAETVVEVTVVGDSLALLNVPDMNMMSVNDTVTFSASLISADGSAVGPFDAATDVVWTSSDEAVLVVPDTFPDGTDVNAPNGTFAAVGTGSADITATWTGGGVTVSSTETITVDVSAPTLTSLSSASAEAFETVTITGTGFVAAAHVIFIDGFELPAYYNPTIVNSTTATFDMPGGVAATGLEVTVGVAGAVSAPLTIDRVCGTSDLSCATEPANDAAGGAIPVTLPLTFPGYADASDPWDILTFTLGAETTFDINLSWTGEETDMDAVFSSAGVPGYGEGLCGFTTATGDNPETGTCTLAAGTYYVWIYAYNELPAIYTLTLTP